MRPQMSWLAKIAERRLISWPSPAHWGRHGTFVDMCYVITLQIPRCGGVDVNLAGAMPSQ
jgi:hypothetical protein